MTDWIEQEAKEARQAPLLNFVVARRRRRWLDLTQAQLAARIGVSPSTLAKWETGRHEPRVKQLVRWADALGLDPAELLTDPARVA